MLRSFLIQTWRALLKNKTYSLLNIIGLSAGLTCFAFIALWVSDEISYDKFNKNYDRIVRLTGIAKTETGIQESAVSSAPMAKALKEDYPEVENTVRMDMHEEIVWHNGQQVLQGGILAIDPSFFDVFSYQLTNGHKTNALNNPYSIVLTESAAKKYFGDSDPIGKTININMYDTGSRGATYTVTGLIADPPLNAHFTFTMLVSFKTVEVFSPDVLTIDGWGDASYYAYLLLKEGVDHKSFSDKIVQFYEKYVGERLDAWRSTYFYKLQPLRDIYLHSSLQYEIGPVGDINKVYIFSSIAIFILLLAGINYMNLATARSVTKAKEVGIKKVAGAGKRQLILHYLAEAVVTAMLAFIIAIVLCSLLQPFFSEISGKDLSLFSSTQLLFFLLGVTILLGILSGMYPAIVFSGFKPIQVLKGSFKSGPKGIILRKSLVVTQFVITIILITGIIVINAQLSYIKNKDLGFNKNGLLFLRVHGNTEVIDGYETFKNEMLQNSLISGFTTANSLIAGGLGSGGSQTVDSKNAPLIVTTSRLRTDANFLDIYKIKLLAGSNFSAGAASDSIRQVILNEEAVKKIGWGKPEEAIGKPFNMGNRTGIVKAVVKNFHFNSLQQNIEPLAIYPSDGRFSRITMRVDMSKPQEVIGLLERTWKKHFPNSLLDYDFFDRALAGQYRAEEKFSKVFLCFSVLTLLIACLGLYGLIAYATVQKTKEIGIRKVLGATVPGIAGMLSWDFLKLILLALMIAVPVAWYIMNSWLQDFAYRTSVSWWMLGAGGLVVSVIALITVSFEAIKVAITNPVKSLRSE